MAAILPSDKPLLGVAAVVLDVVDVVVVDVVDWVVVEVSR